MQKGCRLDLVNFLALGGHFRSHKIDKTDIKQSSRCDASPRAGEIGMAIASMAMNRRAA
jgi:hypothetical protein